MDLATALGVGHEIQWREYTVRLSYLTLRVLTRFSNWLKANARESYTSIEDAETRSELKAAFQNAVLLGEFDIGGAMWRKSSATPGGMIKLVQFMAVAQQDGKQKELTEAETADFIAENIEALGELYNMLVEESLGPKARWRTETR